MVTLPTGFVATKYVGYFWNIPEKALYSLKMGGYLRKLKYQRPNYFNNFRGGYGVSVKGNRRYLPDVYLHTLKLVDSEIPILVQEKVKDARQQSFKFTDGGQRTQHAGRYPD